MQYCNGSGTCATNKKPNGEACRRTTDCGSGYCVDGVCCNGACTGTCQACNVPGRLGACGNVLPGATDASCGTGQYCDAAAICQTGAKPNGADLRRREPTAAAASASTALCCTSACTDTCYACNVPGTEGTCSPTPNRRRRPDGDDDLRAAQLLQQGPRLHDGQEAERRDLRRRRRVRVQLLRRRHLLRVVLPRACRSCKNATGTCARPPRGRTRAASARARGRPRRCGGTCDGAGSCRYAAERPRLLGGGLPERRLHPGRREVRRRRQVQRRRRRRSATASAA